MQKRKNKTMYVVIGLILIVAFVVWTSFFILPRKIDVSSQELSMKKGEITEIQAKVFSIIPILNNVDWKSSDPLVATVEEGVITAHKKGECDITAKTINGKRARCHITVVSNEERFEQAVTEIVEYVKDNADSYSEGIYTLKVKTISPESRFSLAVKDNFLFLMLETKYIYNTNAVSATYRTFIAFQAENPDYAMAQQADVIDSMGITFETTGEAVMNLNSYCVGDRLTIRTFTYIEDGRNMAGATPTDEFVEKLNCNTNALTAEFKSFLEENEEINYKFNDIFFGDK